MDAFEAEVSRGALLEAEKGVPEATTGENLGVFLPLSSGCSVPSLFYLRGPEKNSKGP